MNGLEKIGRAFTTSVIGGSDWLSEKRNLSGIARIERLKLRNKLAEGTASFEPCRFLRQAVEIGGKLVEPRFELCDFFRGELKRSGLKARSAWSRGLGNTTIAPAAVTPQRECERYH
jgi:hypothetical protein